MAHRLGWSRTPSHPRETQVQILLGPNLGSIYRRGSGAGCKPVVLNGSGGPTPSVPNRAVLWSAM